MFQSPGPIFFSYGPIVIRWYGVMIALGFMAASYFGKRLAKSWGLDPDKIINLILITFIGGIIGARLYFVALNWQEFSLHPQTIFATWLGGMSIHGGFIGALITGYLYCRFNKIPFWTACDLGGIVLPLGQAIGRWGNFFNSECFGGPVPNDFPLKLYIPPDRRPYQFQGYDYFHPAFLYESAWDLAMFFILYFYLGKKLKRYPGVTFMAYLALYSVGRLMIEPLRTDSIMKFGIAFPILASAVTLVVSIVAALCFMYRYKKRGTKT